MDRFLVLFLVFCASTASAAQSKGEALAADRVLWAPITSSQIVAPKPVPKDWHIIQDPSFHLSLGFPCVPERDVSHRGNNDYIIYKCADSGISYVALYNSELLGDGFNPDESHAATIVGFMNSAKRSGLNMTVIPQMRMSYLGLNGRQMKMKFESRLFEREARVLFQRNLSCILQISGPPDQLETMAVIFFNSLQVEQ